MTENPNIILLTLDALRADHLSGYGYDLETTPELDAFADAEAATFTAGYSASSHTREAVPSILTGQYPDKAVTSGYRRNAPTVAERLSAAGYSTAGFHSNPFVSRAYGFDTGFDHFDDDLHLGRNKLLALAQRALDKLRNRHYARATEINERSLSWIDGQADEPFFCWNHYMDPHGPYEAPAEYQREYHGEVVPDRTAQRLYQRAIDDPDSISADERERLIDLYDAEIAYTDEKLAAFFDALHERDLLKDSLIVVTADHGDAFGEHGYYEHPRYLHEELVHVPLLVSAPGVDPGVLDTPASTLDVAATVLAAAGVTHDSLPGADLRAVAADPDAYHDRTVISQARGENAESHLRRFSARGQSSTWLATYDTDTDEVDMEGGGAADAVSDELRTHIEDRVTGEGFDADEADDEVDEEIEDRLSALGYK
jgi:arylsulfatase